MTLYVCRVEFDLVVEADNERDAVRTAIRYAPDELSSGLAEYQLRELKTARDLPEDLRDSLPWGGKRNGTVGELLKAVKP